ncbi:MAG: 4Fe-4S binding protein [Candidatus Buchananbacteria bacterium]
MPIYVDKNKCPQNHACPAIKVCPQKALSQKGFSAPKVDMKKCLECGICSNFCPKNALQLR